MDEVITSSAVHCSETMDEEVEQVCDKCSIPLILRGNGLCSYSCCIRMCDDCHMKFEQYCVTMMTILHSKTTNRVCYVGLIVLLCYIVVVVSQYAYG